MRFLFVLTTLCLALAGCNGGEDFSDATVPGCPAGAPCDASSRGDVLVELTGPHVSNLGYTCTGTNVSFFTSDTDQQSVDSDGNVVTVPAFNALCPNAATGVEFLVGDALFEGNYFSLGEVVLPRKEVAEKYTVTVSDLKNSPFRVAATSDAQTRNVAAFLHGLDAAAANTAFIDIPVQAHDIADTRFEDFDQPFDTASYADFKADWAPYFDAVDDATVGIAMLEPGPSPNDALATLTAANHYSRAGNYRFDTCKSQFSAFFCGAGNTGTVDLRLPNGGFRQNQDGGRVEVLQQAPLILPNGRILGLGNALRSDGTTTESGFVAFSETATVNELLQLNDAQVLSLEPSGTGDTTDVTFQGRFLNKRIYNDFLPQNGSGDTDLTLDYPAQAGGLAAADTGKASGLVATENETLPLSAEVLAVPQVLPDHDAIATLAAGGPYTVRLLRACTQQDLNASPSRCKAIDNIEQEVGAGPAFNYPAQIDVAIEKEQARKDGNAVGASADATEFCLEAIGGQPSDADYGVITAGPIGDCGKWQVGFVSRAFGSPPQSANLTLFLVPGAEFHQESPNFGVTIQGRVDLANNCHPMYRTGDDSFTDKVRAAWVDDYYPSIKAQEFVDGLPDGQNLTVDQQALIASLQQGAVQFFAGAPGDINCDPAAQP